MKQYVLDEPGARAPVPTLGEAAAPRSRWRWPIVLAAVAATGLVAAHLFIEHQPRATPRAAETAPVPVYVAPVAIEPPRAAVGAAPASPAELPPSRVTRANGRYVVDLHAAAIGAALAMLSEATHTTVTGSDVVAASPSRITTSFVAGSPLDAWKGVFGDIASFAMTCGQAGCAVRFVSLVGDRAAASPSMAVSPPPPTAYAPIAPAAPAAPAAEGQSGEQATPDN